MTAEENSMFPGEPEEEENENESEEEEPLNYKAAYLQTFHFLTELSNSIQRIQKIAEAICIGDVVSERDLELDRYDELFLENSEQ